VDRSRDPAEYLASGDAWSDFCEELKEVGAELMRPTAPKAPIDLAEGHRYLMRMLRAAGDQIVEAGDAAKPWFFASLCETQKSGWDNPDNHHSNAYISGAYDYRVSGRAGEAYNTSLAVYGGSLGRGGGRSTIAYKTFEELGIAAGEQFEIILSQREHPGHWIQTSDAATTLMVRETFWDKPHQRRAELHIERVGGPPYEPLSPDFMVSALRRSLRFINGSTKLFFDTADEWTSKPNTFHSGDPRKAESTLGIPGQYYASGWWEVAPDEAIVLEWTPPECSYWNISLCDYWGGSFDYRYWNIHVNKMHVQPRSDASLCLVIAHSDPGLAESTWLDTAGHASGVWTLRYLGADTHPMPEPRLVKLDSLGSAS
jgi:hypothetical protein